MQFLLLPFPVAVCPSTCVRLRLTLTGIWHSGCSGHPPDSPVARCGLPVSPWHSPPAHLPSIPPFFFEVHITGKYRGKYRSTTSVLSLPANQNSRPSSLHHLPLNSSCLPDPNQSVNSRHDHGFARCFIYPAAEPGTARFLRENSTAVRGAMRWGIILIQVQSTLAWTYCWIMIFARVKPRIKLRDICLGCCHSSCWSLFAGPPGAAVF